jgi:tetrahydromethanopterin S-methyltransferase subunit A
MEDQIIQL